MAMGMERRMAITTQQEATEEEEDEEDGGRAKNIMEIPLIAWQWFCHTNIHNTFSEIPMPKVNGTHSAGTIPLSTSSLLPRINGDR